MSTSVLIIDDDEIDRMALKRLIKKWRRRTTIQEANGCDEAYRFLAESTPDVILCDWSMQPDDGFNFLRWLRDGSDSPDTELPVILTSGYIDDYMASAAANRGANAVLEKPVHLDGLRECLNGLGL